MPTCRLKKVLYNALTAYFAELDGVTLADIAGPRKTLGKRNAVADGLKAQGRPVNGPATRRLRAKAN